MIWNCEFRGFGGQGIMVEGYASTHSLIPDGRCRGVIWNCFFYDCYMQGLGYGIHVLGAGDIDWDNPDMPGTEEAVFIEDCYIENSRHAISSENGARYVFRYNNIDTCYASGHQLDAAIDAHGYCFWRIGSVSYEIYGNTLNSVQSYRGMYIRGGTGVIFNNTLTGNFVNPIHLHNYRSCQDCTGNQVFPVSCTEGHPCQDQINELYIWIFFNIF